MPPAAPDLQILLRDPFGPEALFLLREAAVEARRLYANPSIRPVRQRFHQRLLREEG
jgi:hypothetical protein